MRKHAVVDAKTFSNALEQTSKVLRKMSIPILSEVSVRFSGGACTLTGTDMETWLISNVPADGDDFSFVFRRTKEVERASRLFEGELSLELCGAGEGKERVLTLCMRCGDRAVEFEVMDAEDYPECAPFEAGDSFTVNAADLLRRIGRVGYAARRPNLNDRQDLCSIQFSGNHVLALDGLRLACDTDQSLRFPKPFMAYGESLAHLKLFGEKEVRVELGTHRGRITDGTSTVDFRLTGVNVYPVESSVPKGGEEFYVSPKKFLCELKYLKEFTANSHKPYIRFSNGELFMPTVTGKCRTSVEISGQSEITFAFDLHKMTDALRQFQTEPAVKLKVHSATMPFIIEADGRSDFALVCPVRLSDRLMAA